MGTGNKYNLSEQQVNVGSFTFGKKSYKYPYPMYREVDVKEFIKKLKKEFKKYLHYGDNTNDVDYIIDKCAGENFVK